MKPIFVLSAGITATVFMTLVLIMAPYFGFPNMDVGALLGNVIGSNEMMGWVEHFMIGIIMAFVYVTFFNDWLPVQSDVLRGTAYGFIVFVFSEINLAIINSGGFINPDFKKNLVLLAIGNGLACLAYGTVLGIFIKRNKQTAA